MNSEPTTEIEHLEADAGVRGLIDAAIEIASRRGALLLRLRRALELNDSAEAIRLARMVCGLEP